MATDEDGEFGYQALLPTRYASLVKMVETGFLSEEELRQMAITTVGRSQEELMAPLGEQESKEFAGHHSPANTRGTFADALLFLLNK